MRSHLSAQVALVVLGFAANAFAQTPPTPSAAQAAPAVAPVANGSRVAVLPFDLVQSAAVNPRDPVATQAHDRPAPA